MAARICLMEILRLREEARAAGAPATRMAASTPRCWRSAPRRWGLLADALDGRPA